MIFVCRSHRMVRNWKGIAAMTDQEMSRRFDAFAELILRLGQTMDGRFDRLDARLDRLETSLDRVENRLDVIEVRIGGIEAQMRRRSTSVNGAEP